MSAMSEASWLALMSVTAGHRVPCACMHCESVSEIARLRVREQQLKAALDEMHTLVTKMYEVAIR